MVHTEYRMQITHLLYLLAGAVGPLAREPGQGVGLLLLPPALLQLPSPCNGKCSIAQYVKVTSCVLLGR